MIRCFYGFSDFALSLLIPIEIFSLFLNNQCLKVRLLRCPMECAERFTSAAYTSEGDEPGGSILIEKHEKEHYPIGSPYPITAIKFRQEHIKRK